MTEVHNPNLNLHEQEIAALAANAALIDPAHVITQVGTAVTAVVTAEPGFRTTEFWITVVTQLLSVLTLFHVVNFNNDQVQGIVGITGLVLPQIIYTLGRSQRKAGTQG